jgi:hypothetical protein
VTFMTGVFIIILAGIAGGTIGEVAKAIARRGGGGAKVAELTTRVERCAAAVEETHTTLASQAAELAELQERVDFAERLLTQTRERMPLGPGQPPR